MIVLLHCHKAIIIKTIYMNKTEKKTVNEPKTSTSRERIARRIIERFPERRFECEDDVYDALDEYDTFMSEQYEQMLTDHNRLTELMYNNPRVGAFITEVADGEDALVACVRYFGRELFDNSNDKQKMNALRKANDEYVERNRNFREMEEAMHKNIEKSARSMERFMRNKKMNMEEFDDFLERIFHVCRHVFAGDLNEDVLELMHKGLRYDIDLPCAQHAAEVKGRNSRILMTRRDAVGDTLSHESTNTTPESKGGGYRRPRRRRSVWDL